MKQTVQSHSVWETQLPAETGNSSKATLLHKSIHMKLFYDVSVTYNIYDSLPLQDEKTGNKVEIGEGWSLGM
jgi:hypothetical protein